MTDSDRTERILVATARMEEKINSLEDKVDIISRQLNDDFVRKTSFEPVQRVVYGVVGIIVIAVFTALVALVVSGGA